MSEVTGSGTEVIHVRLLDEAVDVWRPVQAVPLGDRRLRIAAQPVPEDETWEFSPRQVVACERRPLAEGAFLAAVSVSA